MNELKQVIIVRTDLGMKKGKIASQVAHASLTSYLDTLKRKPEWAKDWLPYQKKVVLKVNSLDELLDIYNKVKNIFPCALIRDAGLTQIQPGTITALGVGPVPEVEVDKYTKHLKLL